MFTSDARFVLSGSDDGNVRLWKAKAAEKLGIIDARERAAMEYRESLKERWKVDLEVGRISRCVRCARERAGMLTPYVQTPASAQAGSQGESAQENNVGRWSCQGRSTAEAFASWREEAEGRAKENGRCGTNIMAMGRSIGATLRVLRVVYR